MSTPPSASAMHFNPRSPHGERREAHMARHGKMAFQPTLPARGATSASSGPRPAWIFQPTLPARGATASASAHTPPTTISTHAPRTGSDIQRHIMMQQQHNFNPRSPHGERPHATQSIMRARGGYFNPRSPHGERLTRCGSGGLFFTFQPTLPARGATARCMARRRRKSHFNPRSPHGERLAANTARITIRINFNPRSPHGERPPPKPRRFARTDISTHAPRTGSDAIPYIDKLVNSKISTHAPRTGSDGTNANYTFANTFDISTHAPRTGSDCGIRCVQTVQSNFNPRSPHGERLLRQWRFRWRRNFNPRSPHGERRICSSISATSSFQPTLPARGATGLHGNAHAGGNISTHAPRTGSDPVIQRRFRHREFQPTLPARGATLRLRPGRR